MKMHTRVEETLPHAHAVHIALYDHDHAWLCTSLSPLFTSYS